MKINTDTAINLSHNRKNIYSFRKIKRKIKSYIVEMLMAITSRVFAILGREFSFLKVLNNGAKIYLNIQKKIQFIQFVKPIYEPHIYKVIKQFVRESDVVVDVGAHIGYWSVILAKEVGPKGRVISFEPDDNNFASLVKNIKLNDFTNVIAEKKAVSKTSGTSFLATSVSNDGGHYVVESRDSVSQDIRVNKIDTTTLDSVFEKNNLLSCKFIKIDAEGHEIDVIQGMSMIFEKIKPQYVIIESSKGDITKRQKVYNIMLSFGYQCRDIYNPTSTQSILPSMGGEDMFFVA